MIRVPGTQGFVRLTLVLLMPVLIVADCLRAQPCGFLEDQILPVAEPGTTQTEYSALDADGPRLVVSRGVQFGPEIVMIFKLEGKQWVLEQTLTAEQKGSNFGSDIAIDGTTLVVGASSHEMLGINSGAVHVFQLSEGTWTQTALIVPTGMSSMTFGAAVDLRNQTLLVGAPLKNTGALASGAAFIFEYDGTTWIQKQIISPAVPTQAAHFGHSVSLSVEDALIGTRYDQSGLGAGKAYVYSFNGSIWSQTHILEPSDGVDGMRFGNAVELEGDVAAIAAPALSNGSVYLFERNSGVWQQVEKLSGPSPQSDQFARSIDLHGSLLSVGNPQSTQGGAFPNGGYGYLFERTENGWVEQFKVYGSDVGPLENFGVSAALTDANIFYFVEERNAVYAFLTSPAECNDNGIPDHCESPDCNHNAVPDACELAAGDEGDCNANGMLDVCEPPVEYILDIDFKDQGLAWGLPTPGDFIWLNQFNVLPGAAFLTHIELEWGPFTPPSWPMTLFVFADPNGDGDPSDAVLLTSQPTQTLNFGNSSGLTAARIKIPPTHVGDVGDSFFIGAYVPCPEDFNEFLPATSEYYASNAERSWYVTTELNTFDLENPSQYEWTNFHRKWMIRGLSLDCNNNGVWDDCDIEQGTSLDANGNGTPDECETPICAADIAPSAGNGIVDTDDLLLVINNWGAVGSNVADITGDGNVDTDDLLAVINAWGVCE